jgi:hypothetical protein
LPWISIQHAKFTGPPPTVADLGTVGQAIGTAWANAMAPIHDVAVAVTEVKVTDLTSRTANVAVSTMNHPGTHPGTGSLPLNVAMVQSYVIQVRYRGGHPRTYWPAGVPSDIQTGHLWTTAFLANANTAATGWVGDINLIALGGGTLQHCAVSYFHGKDSLGKPIVRVTPLVFPTTSTLVHGRVDTMRRRLGKEVA